MCHTCDEHERNRKWGAAGVDPPMESHAITSPPHPSDQAQHFLKTSNDKEFSRNNMPKLRQKVLNQGVSQGSSEILLHGVQENSSTSKEGQ